MADLQEWLASINCEDALHTMVSAGFDSLFFLRTCDYAEFEMLGQVLASVKPAKRARILKQVRLLCSGAHELGDASATSERLNTDGQFRFEFDLGARLRRKSLDEPPRAPDESSFRVRRSLEEPPTAPQEDCQHCSDSGPPERSKAMGPEELPITQQYIRHVVASLEYVQDDISSLSLHIGAQLVNLDILTGQNAVGKIQDLSESDMEWKYCSMEQWSKASAWTGTTVRMGNKQQRVKNVSCIKYADLNPSQLRMLQNMSPKQPVIASQDVPNPVSSPTSEAAMHEQKNDVAQDVPDHVFEIKFEGSDPCLGYSFEYLAPVTGVTPPVELCDVSKVAQLLLSSHEPVALLLRAGPGTGKTWSSRQIAWLVARSLLNGGWLGGEKLVHRETVPLLIPIQKLAVILRASEPRGNIAIGWATVEQFIDAEFSDKPACRDTLVNMLVSRKLTLIFDGLDEASDLAEVIEAFIVGEVLLSGMSFVVTSRPTGVRLKSFKQFIILNLKPFSDEQVWQALETQLAGNEFYTHLVAVSKIRKNHDKLFCASFSEKGRKFLSELVAEDRFKQRGAFDPQMRQTIQTPEGVRFVAPQVGSLRSAYLNNITVEITACHLLEKLTKILVNSVMHTEASVRAALDEGSCAGASPSAKTLDVIARMGMLLLKMRKSEPGLSAEALWARIARRTDEIYVVAERYYSAAQSVMEALAPKDSTVQNNMGPLKDPVRLYEKARDDYRDRFEDEELPEACVVDVIRCRMCFSEGGELVAFLQKLCSNSSVCVPVHVTEFQGDVYVECIRMKNKFSQLDPTHFRNCLCNIRLTFGKQMVFCEMQVHHLKILTFNDESHAHDHYEFFRRELCGTYENDLDSALDKLFQFYDEISGVPVLLSVLTAYIHDRKDAAANRSFPMSRLALYLEAFQGILNRELSPERSAIAYQMLQRVGGDIMLREKRIFTTSEVQVILADSPAALELWASFEERGNIPLVKILSTSSQSGCEMQFKHLSFQEALCVPFLAQGNNPEKLVSLVLGGDSNSFFDHVVKLGPAQLIGAASRFLSLDVLDRQAKAVFYKRLIMMREHCKGDDLVDFSSALESIFRVILSIDLRQRPATSTEDSVSHTYTSKERVILHGVRSGDFHNEYYDDWETYRVIGPPGFLSYVAEDDYGNVNSEALKHGNLALTRETQEVPEEYPEENTTARIKYTKFLGHPLMTLENRSFRTSENELTKYEFDGHLIYGEVETILDVALATGHFRSARGIQDALVDRRESAAISLNNFMIHLESFAKACLRESEMAKK